MKDLKIGIYVNPNKNKQVIETTNLNRFSKILRLSDFMKTHIKSEGFELSPFDFKWEYIIHFNRTDAFMVFREYGNKLEGWVYSYDEDLKPTTTIVVNANMDKGDAFVRKVKDLYRNIKKTKLDNFKSDKLTN